jgi:hypothetical protein
MVVAVVVDEHCPWTCPLSWRDGLDRICPGALYVFAVLLLSWAGDGREVSDSGL